MTRKTFQVDNTVMQKGPSFYSQNYKAGQMYLPGFEPLGIFDHWATIALYSLLDPKNPSAPVRVKPTELLRVLEFAQVITSAQSDYTSDYTVLTFPTQNYRLVEESLNRLFTVEVNFEEFWKVKLPGQRRPRKQLVKFRGRILQHYAYWYPGVTQPATLPHNERGRRVNVNSAKTATGETGSPVWKYKEAKVRPYIEYQFASQLVRGLTGEDPNIGATILPFKIFSLRRQFQKSTAATNLLFWVCRQTAPSMTRKIDGLAAELNQNPDYPGRAHEAINEGFALLKKAGIVDNFKIEGLTVAFQKNKDWPFGKDAPLQLVAPKKTKT